MFTFWFRDKHTALQPMNERIRGKLVTRPLRHEVVNRVRIGKSDSTGQDRNIVYERNQHRNLDF